MKIQELEEIQACKGFWEAFVTVSGEFRQPEARAAGVGAAVGVDRWSREPDSVSRGISQGYRASLGKSPLRDLSLIPTASKPSPPLLLVSHWPHRLGTLSSPREMQLLSHAFLSQRDRAKKLSFTEENNCAVITSRDFVFHASLIVTGKGSEGNERPLCWRMHMLSPIFAEV